MSIRECLRDRVTEHLLFEIVPFIPGPRPRSVWVTEYVSDQLSPGTANADFSLEAGRLRRKLENIISGTRIVVGKRRDHDCDMKRLDPAADEVWEIRERNNPSIRIFFRFIELDCLCATNLRLVKDLFAILWLRSGREFWPIWNREIKRCKAIWRSLFHTHPPHSGASLDDYLSNASSAGDSWP